MRIVIGHDGSSFADEAIDGLRLAGLPERGQARVVSVVEHSLLHSKPTSPTGHEGGESSLAQRQAALDGARAVAERGAERVRAALTGNPKHVLLMEAETWRAHGLFLGSRGQASGLDRFLLGSVSSALAARAKCTVEIVRRVG